MKDGTVTALNPNVSVIIAAYNAAATIGRAIQSALAQAEVAEVIVIDDASIDKTVAVARAFDDGTGRLTVRSLELNAGPSRARNVAIAESKAPLIAVLDADDFFLPGRFAALLEVADWDLIADNIVFVGEDSVAELCAATIAAHRTAQRTLTAADFVEGCITRTGRHKGEFGFLKPVIARAFLDRHALRYADEMRLSEDYDLYVRALIAGARFRIAASCHYVAVERAGSLSVRHGVAELEALEAAMWRLRAEVPTNDAPLRNALERHHAQVARKRLHRAVLARKREVGTLRALRENAETPRQLAYIFSDVIIDKLRSGNRGVAPTELRFLLEALTHQAPHTL